MPTQGIDLKVERIRAKVKAQDLAAQMRVSRATLWAIERMGDVDRDRVAQYRDALNELKDVRLTSDTAAIA
jgi:transcriptional regulator with XRE-family HTH domain